ncbi:MAG: tetratricopeptide repeat protein [Candidatus Obscuribacterales bacterium]|nr:tetratricopeptide repeat protein [Candidatus Obscuribacterales bacterium]
MTNSTNVIRTRRTPPTRGWIVLGGIVVVAATIPISMSLQSNTFVFPDFGKVFSGAPSQPTSIGTSSTKAQLIQVQMPGSKNDQAAYVEALDQASRKLAAQIAKSPADPALQNQLGMIYLTLGDSKSAEQCFTTAISLSRSEIEKFKSNVEKLKDAHKMRDASNAVLAASKMTVELSAAHSNLARVYDLRGDRQAVITELEELNKDGMLFTGFAANGNEVLKTSKDGVSPETAQAMAQAEALFRSSQLPAALAAFHGIAQKNANIAFVQDRIGLISVMTGDVSSGIEAWEQAAKLNPTSASIESNLGLAYHQMGMDGDAERAFRKALAIDPAMEEAALSLSDLLSKNGRIADATAVMKASAAHSPKSARAQNNLGTFLSMSGNFADSITAFHKAIRIDPSMASAHYGLGVALMRTHKYMPAIRELKQALVLNPKLAEAQLKIEEAHRLAMGGSR